MQSLRSSVTNSAVELPRGRVADFRVEARPYGWCGLFQAMASPCEVHLHGIGRRTAEDVVATVHDEARRIETKFSRYRQGNIVDRINRAAGASVAVDEETARLLDYAAELFRLSDGRFDITSGALRRAWKFDGGEAVPDALAIAGLMPTVGWGRIDWRPPRLRMPAGMEVDFGGIGKEYAVDRAAMLVRDSVPGGMINFGGDLLAFGAPAAGEGWTVGIETLEGGRAAKRIALTEGALATSGDSKRFVTYAGRRYGHILDARTGWPVENAPRSVTVLASTCTQAGMLATFAMLMGAAAESFLDTQGVRHWSLRQG